MKPKVYRYRTNWWNVRFYDKSRRKYRVIFADTWNEAIKLVEHGYRENYF